MSDQPKVIWDKSTKPTFHVDPAKPGADRTVLSVLEVDNLSVQIDDTKPSSLKSLDVHGLGQRFLDCVVMEDLTEELQDITIYFDPPAFIMSPRIRLYRPDQIFRFRGYLSSFHPAGFDEEGQPQAKMTITVTESVKDTEP